MYAPLFQAPQSREAELTFGTWNRFASLGHRVSRLPLRLRDTCGEAMGSNRGRGPRLGTMLGNSAFARLPLHSNYAATPSTYCSIALAKPSSLFDAVT